MPEQPGGDNSSQNNPNPPVNNGDNSSKGNDPAKNGNDGQSTTVDFSKLGDEQLMKVLEDPRLWKSGRLAELRDKAKKADELTAAQQKAEEENLKKKGEFEKLANQKQEEANTWKTKFETAQIDNAIMNEAAKKGITDLEAAKLLIDRSKVSLDDTGTPQGVAEAVDALVTLRPYLKGGQASNTSVGSGTNPPNPNQDYDFTMSQIGDAKFYQEHRDEILRAQAKGRIKEDRF